MKLRVAAGVVCVVLAAMVTVRAADDKPADAKADKKPAGRLFAPWSKMTSLSDDQKDKIKDIHAKTLAQIKEIHEKEEADIMALLSDKQKDEVKELMAKDKAKTAAAKDDPDAAAKAAEKKEAAAK